MKTAFTIYTLAFALFMLTPTGRQECIHDELSESSIPVARVHYHDVLDSGERDSLFREKREVTDDSTSDVYFRPIRVHIHYSLGVTVDAGRRDMLIRVVDRAVSRISSIFAVRPVENPLLLSRSCSVVFGGGINKGKCARLKGYRGEFCLDTFRIPDEHLGELHVYNATYEEPVEEPYDAGPGLNDTDLILYVSAKNTALCLAHPSVMAYAAHCQVDQNGRPVAGLANFCPLALLRSHVSEGTLFQTVLHEILHVLGFSVSLFGSFKHCTNGVCEHWKNPVRSVLGVMRLVTWNVVNQTQQHFGCNIADFGGALNTENSKATSHWDSRMMHTSLMTALDNKASASVLDPITLAVFQDSGWYQVDFTKADKFLWGKDDGCDFGMPESCLRENEYFCSGNSSGCHFLQHDKAVCDAVTTGKCGLFLPTEQGSCQLSNSTTSRSQEIFSPSSRCFFSSVGIVTNTSKAQLVKTVGRCYEHKCSADGNLHIRTRNSDWIHCPAGEAVSVPGLEGEIYCPADVDILCVTAAPSTQQSVSSTSRKPNPTTLFSEHQSTSQPHVITPASNSAKLFSVHVFLLSVLLSRSLWV